MNIRINSEWAAFKAHLVRTVGYEGAGDWLRYAAGVMDMEARRRAQPIEGVAVEQKPERVL